MILDTLTFASDHRYLRGGFPDAFDWLGHFIPETPDGRYPIDGDDVFALVQSYETTPATTKRYETHRAYADLQYLVAGSEIIYYAPLDQLTSATPYDDQQDYELFNDPPISTPLQMSPGTFAIFLPQDGHKPGCSAGSISRVRKAVVKIRI